MPHYLCMVTLASPLAILPFPCRLKASLRSWLSGGTPIHPAMLLFWPIAAPSAEGRQRSTTLTLHQISRELGLGHGGVILAWAHRHEDFGQQYARAREHQMQLRADELLEIADDASNDWIDVEMESGRVVRTLDHEHVKRSEVRIRTRMWLMQRYAPKVFGERLTLTDADGGNPKKLRNSMT